MKKHVVRVLVLAISYLWIVSSLLLMLHIFNYFLQLSPAGLSLVTDFAICIPAIGLLLGLRIYYAKKKEK